MSAGRLFQLRPLPSMMNPSHMCRVIETYFWTSYNFAVSILTSGFSCPSTIFVCSAE